MNKLDKIEYFTEMAESMFGKHWKMPLSEFFGVTDRTIRRWATGENEIPDEAIRGMLSFMYARIRAITAAADEIAMEFVTEDGYERIIYMPSMQIANMRIDLDVETREWFDIDGKLYAIHSDGTVIDMSGNNAALPDGVSIEQLYYAKKSYIENPENQIAEN
ncbi:hypothetical protein [Sodalis sp. RH16]|uniref:hypothetical protein n=1 Tax=Sodalis sp. RH16 TaxID=3394331 RepID=UPI0039B6B974